jgi:hypothetical protein
MCVFWGVEIFFKLFLKDAWLVEIYTPIFATPNGKNG